MSTLSRNPLPRSRKSNQPLNLCPSLTWLNTERYSARARDAGTRGALVLAVHHELHRHAVARESRGLAGVARSRHSLSREDARGGHARPPRVGEGPLRRAACGAGVEYLRGRGQMWTIPLPPKKRPRFEKRESELTKIPVGRRD